MQLNFTKMHGLGNDFVVIDATDRPFDLAPERIRHLADRHFGIGFDQLLVVEPPSSDEMDFSYRIFNSDGGEVEQCGNGARCFARFVHDKGLTEKRCIRVGTLSGIIVLELTRDDQVRVDMGIPQLAPERIPFVAPARQDSYALELPDQTIEQTGVIGLQIHGGAPSEAWYKEIRIKDLR